MDNRTRSRASWTVRIVAFLASVVTAVPALLLPTGGPAAAAAYVAGNISVDHNGLCLDVSGGPAKTDPAAELMQWECLGTSATNQRFNLFSVGDGYWQIRPDNALDSCLDVVGGPGATGNTVRIQRHVCLGAGQTNQHFRIVADGGSGRYQIRARHSDKCLDVIGGPSGATWGVRLQQYTCLGPAQHNQYFHLYGFAGF